MHAALTSPVAILELVVFISQLTHIFIHFSSLITLYLQISFSILHLQIFFSEIYFVKRGPVSIVECVCFCAHNSTSHGHRFHGTSTHWYSLNLILPQLGWTCLHQSKPARWRGPPKSRPAKSCRGQIPASLQGDFPEDFRAGPLGLHSPSVMMGHLG